MYQRIEEVVEPVLEPKRVLEPFTDEIVESAPARMKHKPNRKVVEDSVSDFRRVRLLYQTALMVSEMEAVRAEDSEGVGELQPYTVDTTGDFEDNISIEQRELAIQRARIQLELEFHRRLANLGDEGDQISLRDMEREHRRNIQQMEEELREKERDIERQTREESHEVRAKCRRGPLNRIRCNVRGCGVIIDSKREQYYRKSCNHAPAIIRFMWYMTDSGIPK